MKFHSRHKRRRHRPDRAEPDGVDVRAGGLGGGAAGQVQGQDAPHRRRHALPLRPQLRLARPHLLGGALEMKNIASDLNEEQCLFRVTGQNGEITPLT